MKIDSSFKLVCLVIVAGVIVAITSPGNVQPSESSQPDPVPATIR